MREMGFKAASRVRPLGLPFQPGNVFKAAFVDEEAQCHHMSRKDIDLIVF